MPQVTEGGCGTACNVAMTARADDAWVEDPRIVAAALFDDRARRVIVAGQVLGGNRGIEGVDVRITTASMTIRVTTGAMGSFGAHIDSGVDAVGETVQVSARGLIATCIATFEVR